MTYLSVSDLRALDEHTIRDLGIPAKTLMENAGRAIAKIIEVSFPAKDYNRVLIVCGKGNNGGDGFVLANLLIQKGYQVTVGLAYPRTELKGASLECFVQLTAAATIINAEQIPEKVITHDLLIDAILGTGLTGPVASELAPIISACNESGKPLVAVDIPTGINGDNGPTSALYIKPTVTITLVCEKISMQHPGQRSFYGQLIIADIGIAMDKKYLDGLHRPDPTHMPLIENNLSEFTLEIARSCNLNYAQNNEFSWVSGKPLEYPYALFDVKLPRQQIPQITSAMQAGLLPKLWCVSPTAAQEFRQQDLIANGFIKDGEQYGFFQIINQDTKFSIRPCDTLKIVQVKTAAEFKTWCDLAASHLFELKPHDIPQLYETIHDLISSPRFCFYLGYYNNEPVGCSALFLGQESAGIYFVTVAPQYRKLGFGQNLTLAPLLAAQAKNISKVVLLSSAMGLPVYRKLGFKQSGRFETWWYLE